MERRRVYYKGEGGGFPQVWAVVSLVCPGCPWLVLTPKVLRLCTNHLVLVLCRSVWVNKACHFFLVPSWSSNTPLYPSIVLRIRERASTLCPSTIFSLGLTFESRKELGVRHQRLVNKQYRVKCTPTWFASTIKEVKNKFHNNFVIGLNTRPLFYKGINLGFTT
jgi:hypothetical protein